MKHNPFDQIIQNYHENQLSHAFLIETNDQDHCLKDLKKVLKEIICEQKYEENCIKCNLCHLVETEQLPSLEIVRLEGQNIKKEQILELKQKFSTVPIFTKYNIYIILNAEKFNSSSANTILKFLEEPEEGILGFFISNNEENMIDTIKSRCQIVSVFYDNIEEKISLDQIAIRYLKEVHESKDFSLIVNRDFFLELDFKKDLYQLFFQSIFQIYYEFYQISLGQKSLEEKYNILKFLLENNSKFFLKQLNLVKQLEEELSYNVNINLLLDRFVLETRS